MQTFFFGAHAMGLLSMQTTKVLTYHPRFSRAKHKPCHPLWQHLPAAWALYGFLKYRGLFETICSDISSLGSDREGGLSQA